MEDKGRFTQMDINRAISSSQRTRSILDFLDQQLHRPHEPSDNDLKDIIESIIAEPEPYRTIGLTTIAEHFVSGMRLHLLNLVAIFKEKAQQEGFSQKECSTTLEDVLPTTFSAVEELRKLISIQSLDGLVILYNITIKLYTLSSAETALDAQRWLYELPTTYIHRLKQAGMFIDEENSNKKTSNDTSIPSTQFISWQTSYTSSSVQQTQKVDDTTNIIISTTEESLQKPVPVEIETRDPKFRSIA